MFFHTKTVKVQARAPLPLCRNVVKKQNEKAVLPS